MFDRWEADEGALGGAVEGAQHALFGFLDGGNADCYRVHVGLHRTISSQKSYFDAGVYPIMRFVVSYGWWTDTFGWKLGPKAPMFGAWTL